MCHSWFPPALRRRRSRGRRPRPWRKGCRVPFLFGGFLCGPLPAHGVSRLNVNSMVDVLTLRTAENAGRRYLRATNFSQAPPRRSPRTPYRQPFTAAERARIRRCISIGGSCMSPAVIIVAEGHTHKTKLSHACQVLTPVLPCSCKYQVTPAVMRALKTPSIANAPAILILAGTCHCPRMFISPPYIIPGLLSIRSTFGGGVGTGTS